MSVVTKRERVMLIAINYLLHRVPSNRSGINGRSLSYINSRYLYNHPGSRTHESTFSRSNNFVLSEISVNNW